MIKLLKDGIELNIKVVPNSSKNDLIIENEGIKLKITAQPIENKANKAVIEFLSKTFKIPKTSISITKGETSKNKTIFIKNPQEGKKEDIISYFKNKEGAYE